MLEDELTETSFVKPWFRANVGASAWGLAIHKSARLFAVSSNAKKIHVFAPALTKPETTESNDSEHHTTPDRFVTWVDGKSIKIFDSTDFPSLPRIETWEVVHHHMPALRSYSVEIVLEGHKANIPNIAFFNSDLEIRKIHLASTDILGWTFIWDVWYGELLLQFRGTVESSKHDNISLKKNHFADRTRVPRVGYCVFRPQNGTAYIWCRGHFRLQNPEL